MRFWYTWQGLQLEIGRCSLASQFVKDKAVLDLGCGYSHVPAYFTSKGARSTIGGDLSREQIASVATHYRRDGLHFIVLDAQQLPFDDCTFDVVTSFEVIEHLRDQDRYLQECERVLKRGGIFVCSTPNRELFSAGLEAPWYPGHVREFSVEELRAKLLSYFQNVELYGIQQIATSLTRIDMLVSGEKPPFVRKLLQNELFRTVAIHVFNLTIGAIRRDQRFIDLKKIDIERLDILLEERYRPLPLELVSRPGNIIAIARR